MLHNNRRVEPLARLRRHSAELACRDFDVVGAQGGGHVLKGQAVAGQLVRADPDPHRVLRAEGLHLAHALHTGKDFLQIGLGVILKIVVVQAPVFRNQGGDEQVIAGGLAHLKPGPLHHVRQAGQRELELVLHFSPGKIRIGACGERQLDPRRAGGRAGAGDVEHVVQAGHLLLDDLRHCVLDRLR